MEAAELSLADGLLDRCRDVAWALHRWAESGADARDAAAWTAAAGQSSASTTFTGAS